MSSEFTGDSAIMLQIGRRLTALRLAQGFTQSALATQAGLSKRTVERIENGHSTQTITLIRILRALNQLPLLEELISPPQASPIELLRHQEHRQYHGKQRVRGKKSSHQNNPWSWEDES